ncbi:MAG TPA: hypothetical protein VH437_10780 [Terriglobales bacterium]
MKRGSMVVSRWSFTEQLPPATVSDGGFAGPDGFRGGVLMALLGALPPITFMEATYDGGGLALLAVTFGPLLIYGVQTSGILHAVRRSPK